MLSIIVSTYNSKNFSNFEDSVRETIGKVNFEIIKIENHGKFGLCEAYNIGAAKSKFANLLFVHDDVEFLTMNWGSRLLLHLNKQNVGVIGVAGSIFKTKMLSGWYQNPINGKIFTRANIIQSFKYSSNSDQKFYVNPNNSIFEEVVVIDGVFMAVKKSIWSEIKFDEKLLKNYHGYDLDFSLGAAKKYKNYVCYDILLKHLSEGSPDLSWESEINKVHNKWKNFLPYSIEKIDSQTIFEAEKFATLVWLAHLYNYDLKFWQRIKILLSSLKFASGYNFLLFKSLIKYLIS